MCILPAKKKVFLIILLFIPLLICSTAAEEKVSLYEIGFGKIAKTHKEYMRNSAFTVSETETSGTGKECGYEKFYLVMHRSFSVGYLKKGKEEIISSLTLYAKTKLHPLSDYIGKSKEDFLKAFPLGDSDSDSDHVTFYKSDKSDRVEVAVVYVDGIVDGISIYNGDYLKELARVTIPAE